VKLKELKYYLDILNSYISKHILLKQKLEEGYLDETLKD